ncbi:HAMP domain-containing histidine kinase [Blautia schinkii]|nr:HAMP domain-containing histidine kinase [Blautia schinkii]
MKKTKIFTKTFLYTLGTMLLIALSAHVLLYLLAPRMAVEVAAAESVENSGYLLSSSVDSFQFVMRAIKNALPVSLFICLLLSVLCSCLFSRSMTIPIRQISKAAQKMAEMDRTARCEVSSHDEIGELADNINELYHRLFITIENLEAEKQKVSEGEQAKIDFLRTASHELKTPVTALNATLENMILGVGRYRDHAACLPECKEMTEQLSVMIHEILETSKMNITVRAEPPEVINLSEFLSKLCEPYQLIAAAHGVTFDLKLPECFSLKVSEREFGRAVSNILTNAVNYTERGKKVSVYVDKNRLVVENECIPISRQELPHLFEPFYRPDFSRSRESGGNGLGLYIVATIFSALDITYTFAPMHDPDGMRFTIRL